MKNKGESNEPFYQKELICLTGGRMLFVCAVRGSAVRQRGFVVELDGITDKVSRLLRSIVRLFEIT